MLIGGLTMSRDVFWFSKKEFDKRGASTGREQLDLELSPM